MELFLAELFCFKFPLNPLRNLKQKNPALLSSHSSAKVEVLWEGNKNFRNHHFWFDVYYIISHCTFSSNLFHGQIAQIYIDHLSGHENNKCSPWKVDEEITLKPCYFWAGEDLESRTRGCLNITSAQIWRSGIFSNFCRKKFLGLTKKLLHFFCIVLGVVIFKNHVAKPLDSFNKCRKIILSCRETFFCRNLKNVGMSFLGRCNVETVSPPGF